MGRTGAGRPAGKFLKVLLVCLLGLAVTFGTILGYLGLQEQERRLLGPSLPFLLKCSPREPSSWPQRTAQDPRVLPAAVEMTFYDGAGRAVVGTVRV